MTNMTLVGEKLSPTVGQRLPLKKISQIRKKRKKNLLNTSAIRNHLSNSSLRLLKQYLHSFLFRRFLTQRSFREWCICDVIFQTLKADIKDHLLALIPLTFWVGAILRKVTSAPEFSSSSFSRPSLSILKIKQVCKRDLRSMNSHQPHHLATVCFLSKWGWLLRAANDITIYAVGHALLLEF